MDAEAVDSFKGKYSIGTTTKVGSEVRSYNGLLRIFEILRYSSHVAGEAKPML